MSTSLPPIVAAVRRFVEEEVSPVASALEHADEYPPVTGPDAILRYRGMSCFIVEKGRPGFGVSRSLAVERYDRDALHLAPSPATVEHDRVELAHRRRRTVPRSARA